MHRTWMTAALSVILLATPAWAGSGPEKDATDKGAAETASPTATPANSNPAAKDTKSEQPAAAGYGAEIEQLREMLSEQARQLQAQQERLNALSEELRAARAATASQPAAQDSQGQAQEMKVMQGQLEAVADTTNDLNKKVADLNKDYTAEKKSLGDKIKAVGPFTFAGDIRLRDEPFFGGPVDQSQVRNRMRFRLRFNVNAKLNDEFSGGLSVATGDLNDPISTNQTTNQFFTRKGFALDRAFINYTPHGFKPLSLTGGKFAYPWYRTELTWDNDLNPEGLAQTLSWNFEKTPVLKKIALVGFELPFSEVARTATTNKSIVQSEVYGGQLQAIWQLGGWLKLSTYAGFYNFQHADPIALALAQASASNPTTPVVGALRLGGASVQNSITTITKTTIVTANTGPSDADVPTALPTGVSTIQSAQFRSKFGLFDGIARFDIKTAFPRLPIILLADYVQNTRACANVANIPTAAPANTATATFTLTTSAPCVSSQRRGYWLEGRVGRLADKGDWQLAYTRMMIEREAVLGEFNFSDLRQNSNVTQHRMEITYQLHKNIQLAFTGLFGRPLASTQPMLKRLQFDVIYKF